MLKIGQDYGRGGTGVRVVKYQTKGDFNSCGE